MLLQRVISFLVLLAFLVTGGLTGHARVDLCIEFDGGVELETPFDCCCESASDRSDHQHQGDDLAAADATAIGTDCLTCADVPLGTGDSKVVSSRDLKVESSVPSDAAVAIPVILLPPAPRPASPPSASLLFPACAVTHESVAVTVLRC